MSTKKNTDEALPSISQDILKLLNPEGFNQTEKILKEARETREEIIKVYFSKSIGTESDIDEEYDFLENITDGTLESILNNKPDLLLPGMKVDNSVDVSENIEYFTQRIKDLRNSNSQNENIELKAIDEEEVSNNLEAYNETLKRVYSRLSNIEISEELDMAKKRSLELESKLRELQDITDGVDKFFTANAKISEVKKTTEMNKDEIADDQLVKNIEKLLTETDSIMYAINSHIN